MKIREKLYSYRNEFIISFVCMAVFLLSPVLAFIIRPNDNIFFFILLSSYFLLPLFGGMLNYKGKNNPKVSSLIIVSGITLINVLGFITLTVRNVTYGHGGALFGFSYINYVLFILIASIIGWLILAFFASLGSLFIQVIDKRN